eukprot:9030248-Heterocapsa_arctica.AAC.1
MKCWEHSCHLGCKQTSSECTRSHEIIGSSSALHWAVQAQLLRRGGLNSLPRVLPAEVDAKIDRMRQAALGKPDVKPGGEAKIGGADLD